MRKNIYSLVVFSFVCTFLQTASAQQLSNTAAAVPAPAPAEAAPAPLPVSPVALAPTQSYFPTLPPSNPCKPGKIFGFWKLVNVYESPAGAATSDYAGFPFQHYFFAKDSTYSVSKFAQRTKNRAEFLDKHKRKFGDPLQQFLVHDSGFIYFYNEGNVVDTQACFIVAKDSPGFKKNQMLLMPPAPPAGQAVTTRLVKVYIRLGRI